MPYVINKQNSTETNIFYRDFGNGQPVILIHGWPLTGESWELQIAALLGQGFRCIAYDRRGFGKSDVPFEYDYDSLASDLHTIIESLDLNDVILAGFSMGGGEVVRYFTNYGGAKVAKAMLISSIIPLVPQKTDNPDGVPQEQLDEIMKALTTDRVAFLKEFHKNFYNVSTLSKDVSQARLDADFIVTSQANGYATVKAAEAWAGTDFRSELSNINVPVLIVHGDADKIVPIKTSGDQAAKGISDNTYVVIEGAPHGLNVSHADELNTVLIKFCNE